MSQAAGPKGFGSFRAVPRLTNHHSSLWNIWLWRSSLVKIEGWNKITVKIEKNDMFDSFPNGEDIEYELDTVSFNPT